MITEFKRVKANKAFTHTSSKSLRALIDVKIEIALHSNFIKIALSYYEISSRNNRKF